MLLAAKDTLPEEVALAGDDRLPVEDSLDAEFRLAKHR